MKKPEDLIPAMDRHMISDTENRLIQICTEWGRQAEADEWWQRPAGENSVAAMR